MCDSKWVTVSFHSGLWVSTQVVYLQHCLVPCRLVPLKTAAISARSVYTIQPCITSRHLMRSHTRRAHVYLAVTSHRWKQTEVKSECHEAALPVPRCLATKSQWQLQWSRQIFKRVSQFSDLNIPSTSRGQHRMKTKMVLHYILSTNPQ